MNNFLLAFWQIVDVQLLDKRGYLTICLTLASKDGKLFLRRPEGIREWFQALKVINQKMMSIRPGLNNFLLINDY